MEGNVPLSELRGCTELGVAVRPDKWAARCHGNRRYGDPSNSTRVSAVGVHIEARVSDQDYCMCYGILHIMDILRIPRTAKGGDR